MYYNIISIIMFYSLPIISPSAGRPDDLPGGARAPPPIYLSISLSLSLYIYIYIYIAKELATYLSLAKELATYLSIYLYLSLSIYITTKIIS